jgi:hypothetical protein
MRRSLLLFLLMLPAMTVPAFAGAHWGSYLDQRYGFQSAVPPGFVSRGAPDVDDLTTFDGPDGATLIVWGGPLTDDPLPLDAKDRVDYEVGDGWTITHEAIGKTRASYSGTKGSDVLYAREISGCNGRMHAGFYLQYRRTHLEAMRPVVEKLVKTLKQRDCRTIGPGK